MTFHLCFGECFGEWPTSSADSLKRKHRHLKGRVSQTFMHSSVVACEFKLINDLLNKEAARMCRGQRADIVHRMPFHD